MRNSGGCMSDNDLAAGRGGCRRCLDGDPRQRPSTKGRMTRAESLPDDVKSLTTRMLYVAQPSIDRCRAVACLMSNANIVLCQFKARHLIRLRICLGGKIGFATSVAGRG